MARNNHILSILILIVSSSFFPNLLATDTTECNVDIKLLSQTVDNVYRLKLEPPIDTNQELSFQKSCWFSFETFLHHGIKIEIEKLILKEPDCYANNSLPSDNGCCDYLEIGVGSEIGSNSFQKYCGWLKTEPFVLNSNKIWLRYSIESVDFFEGLLIKVSPFKLLFEKQTSGVISTTSDYFNNMNLTYKILMDSDRIISFNFKNKFGMEKYADKCIDYVEVGVLDKLSLEPTEKNLKFCGREIPESFSFNSDSAYVKVFTNENVRDVGFELEFSSVKYLFTEPVGKIESVKENLMNMTYKIIAPLNKKIELTIDEIKFYPCANQDMDEAILQIGSNNNDVCSVNNHLSILNEKGNIDQDFYDLMQLNSSDSNWKFCDCNKPVKKYISISNELTIKNIIGQYDKTLDTPAYYSISYKFIDSEFKESNQIRIVQDINKLSPINGYLLRIKVPPANHIRLYGKSNKCILPAHSVLRKTKLESKKISILKLQKDEFKANNCSYVFDLSEPRLNTNVTDVNWWHIEWYFKFNSPSEVYDFEVNWIFIKNIINEEKKTSFLRLPAQKGFNITDELKFSFLSFTSERSYVFKMETILDALKTNASLESSYVKVCSLKRDQTMFDEYILPTPKAEKESNIRMSDLVLDSVNSSLTFKRNNEWSFNIEYRLDMHDGDCDFDLSFCNYTNYLVNPYSELPQTASNAFIQHVPKYAAINTYYENEVIETEYNDFYLSASKLNKESEKEMRIYSPLIKVQNNEQLPNSHINIKELILSFDYMMINSSDALIQLFMLQSRSDMRNQIKQYEISDLKSIGTFGTFANQINQNKRLNSNLNECPVKSFSSYINGLETNSYEPIWYKLDGLKFFSCFDFQLAFDFNFNQSTTKTNVGLDNIQLDYGKDLEECDTLNCNSHGICLKYNSENICCCDVGFKGPNCREEIKPCELFSNHGVQVCRNNGSCIDLNENLGYRCDCPDGFIGENCEIEINECDSNPCQNNGQCFDQIGTYKCSCQIGYNGTNCEIESLGCKQKCSNEGTLKCYENKKNQNIVCKCLPGYTGEDCSKKIKINECSLNPCVGADSNCIDLENDFNCICSELRTGRFCEQKLDYCEDYGDLCANNSKCLYANVDGSVLNCSCQLGFTGKYCNETIVKNNCDPNPCNQGKCIPLELGYKCDCPKMHVGQNCDSKPSYPCFKNKCVHGYCIDLSENDYMCSCYGTYTGEFCDKEVCNVNNYMNDFCIKNNTLDVVKDPMFQDQNKCLCLCKNGFKGKKCEIEENVCELINEKDLYDYGSQCQNGGTCIYDSVLNKLKCECADGFIGDRCQLTPNHCQSNPCKYGTCATKNNTYFCKCSEGWQGEKCDQEKEMCNINNECIANQTQSVKFSYVNSECVCLCKPGFEGEKCENNFDDCKNNACKNNAQCIDKIGSYECKCPKGYGGVLCEKKLEKCSAFPCKHGKCEELAIGFTCHCDKSYTGEFCETLIDQCSANPCKNGATCHNLINDYYCACLPEFGNSRNCTERLIDPCITSPCLNNATCTAISMFSKEKNALIYKSFSCRCTNDFQGELCEQPKDICSSNPCKNHGRCTIPKENPNDFKCICFPAFTGKSCEFLFDVCASHPCNNGGICLPTPEKFVCKCPFNFGGPTCEKPLAPCDLMTCLNGGKCKVGVKNLPYCECLDKRFAGTQCEIDVTNEADNSETVKLKTLSLELEKKIDCDFLGNDATSIDYVFTIMLLFCVLILIIFIVYIYVQFKIKKTKKYLKESFDNNDSTEGILNQYR